jgi:hypothetical protein
MLSRHLAAGALTLAALALTGRVHAQNVRMNLPGSAQATTTTLEATPLDLAVDTVAVARGGGGRGGFARGGVGRVGFARGGIGRVGFARGGYYGGGFARGFRGYYGYRGYYGARYFPRYYGGFYGLGYGYGYGYGYPYYGYGYGYGYPYYTAYSYYPYYAAYSAYPGIYYGSSYYPSYYAANPCSGGALVRPYPTMPPATSLATPGPSYASPSVPGPAPAGAAPGTFPYDGGPSLPVPMPSVPETETGSQRGKGKSTELFVSLPAPAAKWQYPAYGEKPTRVRPTYAGPAVIVGKIN